MNNYAPILLAEDDENDILLMRKAFLEAGLLHPLLVVRNGQEAIWYLDGEKPYSDRKKYPWPCLLLLDLRMPRVDGLAVLTWLQKRRRPRDLLVVIFSSSEQESDILQALRLGADAYWVKPQSFPDLVALVGQLHQRLRAWPEAPLWLEPPSHEARL